ERETATEGGELTCEHKKERGPQCLRRHHQDRSQLDRYVDGRKWVAIKILLVERFFLDYRCNQIALQ
ncbi:unnamed protein product, partial [Musa textilis]